MKVKWLLIASLLVGLIAPAFAEVSSEVIRNTASQRHKSCVTLMLAMKMSFGGESQTFEDEATGVMIDSTGLIVTSNSSIDPLSALTGMMDEGSARGMEMKITGVRIRLASGVEVPGKIVLRDTNQDLAFIRPAQPIKDVLSPIDLGVAGQSQLGENILVLSNLGAVGNRAPRVDVQRVVGVIEKPRRQYVIDASLGENLGSPVFNAQGEMLGLLTMKMPKKSGGGGMFSSRAMMNSGLAVIISAEDILDAAKQAPQVGDIKEGAEPPKEPKPVKPPKPPL